MTVKSSIKKTSIFDHKAVVVFDYLLAILTLSYGVLNIYQTQSITVFNSLFIISGLLGGIAAYYRPTTIVNAYMRRKFVKRV